jgi:SAM-dependent methyltransferase
MTAEAAIWQDVEFGSYTADLPLWEELASRGNGLVLELGAGSGRVALHLAGTGNQVLAIEREPNLVEELRRRAFDEDPLSLVPLAMDIAAKDDQWLAVVANSDGPTSPGLAIAPLHVIQQIPPDNRSTALRNIARNLSRGALLAAAIVDESSLLEGGLEGDRVPDMREVDGWVYSSEPLWVQVDERQLKTRRLRKRVSPAGEIERSVHDDLLHRLSPEELEEEARAAGFTPAGRRSIESGPAEADSLVVLLEAS